jgi:hypothetical protein
MIVSIIEEFSFARNTKLINVNNETVYEFMAKPDEEYLDTMVQNQFILFYLKNVEKQEYFTQY